jgi:hypothetical protein
MVAAVAAKAATGVPPHARLRRALNIAPGRTDGAHWVASVRTPSGGMDGRRRPQRGTPSGCEKNRQVFSHFGPPRFGPRQPHTVISEYN